MLNLLQAQWRKPFPGEEAEDTVAATAPELPDSQP